MQFHLNGFEPGDPEISDPAERVLASGTSGSVPKEVDVLIVGCGPAGLTLAAQLSAFPDIKTCIVEQKPARLLLGQADGVACRTMEMFHAYGFAERVLKEACWITETTFWKPDDGKAENIVRSGRVQDVEDGLSEFPHSFSTRRACMIAISMSCANRRRGSSRTIHGVWSTCAPRLRRALKIMR